MIVRGRDPASLVVLEVEVQDGVISAIRPSTRSSDRWLAPGLVDLQVNGYGGIDLNDGQVTPEAVVRLTEKLAALGTTTFVPTLITAEHIALKRSLATLRAAREADAGARHAIPYVHLEGPAISPLDGYRGAHPLAAVRAPSIEEFDDLQQACGGLVGMVTLSPHWPDTPAFIQALRARGVVVALGHTHAAPAQLTAAVDAGARLSTHLGNALPLLLDRHANPIWTQLADDRLSAGFIADGLHLPAPALRAMLRAKGYERSVLVSDSVALAGSPVGRYQASVGGEVEVSADGSIRMVPSGLLAGAGIALKDAVATAVLLSGCSLGEAVSMATRNPGGFAGQRGRLHPGASADLVLFRWAPGERTLAIEEVLVRGMPIVRHSERETH